jgi:hypothetical protein
MAYTDLTTGKTYETPDNKPNPPAGSVVVIHLPTGPTPGTVGPNGTVWPS